MQLVSFLQLPLITLAGLLSVGEQAQPAPCVAVRRSTGSQFFHSNPSAQHCPTRYPQTHGKRFNLACSSPDACNLAASDSTCHILVALRVLIQATFVSKAIEMFSPQRRVAATRSIECY